jgi:hypothetical protein
MAEPYRGRIFLSASVPSNRQPEFLAGGVRPRSVEEAVTALAAAVFRHHGQLVFGGHPTISPMVALVALERTRGRAADEPPVLIYQSEAYRDVLPSDTWALFRTGVARIVWVEAKDGERFDPERRDPQCQRSLAAMRERMLRETMPKAMFCIGGMRGIKDEAEFFLRICRGAPLFLLAGTGGAAAMLASAEIQLEVEPSTRIETLDKAFFESLARSGADEPIPYPVILEANVANLLQHDARDPALRSG